MGIIYENGISSYLAWCFSDHIRSCYSADVGLVDRCGWGREFCIPNHVQAVLMLLIVDHCLGSKALANLADKNLWQRSSPIQIYSSYPLDPSRKHYTSWVVWTPAFRSQSFRRWPWAVRWTAWLPTCVMKRVILPPHIHTPFGVYIAPKEGTWQNSWYQVWSQELGDSATCPPTPFQDVLLQGAAASHSPRSSLSPHHSIWVRDTRQVGASKNNFPFLSASMHKYASSCYFSQSRTKISHP